MATVEQANSNENGYAIVDQRFSFNDEGFSTNTSVEQVGFSRSFASVLRTFGFYFKNNLQIVLKHVVNVPI
jgi:hypothetical protein